MEVGTSPSQAALGVVREVFRIPALRPGQAEVIAAAEAGRDVLFVAPTGAGKSIAYWVPGVAGTGLVLVVSPLIALMTDQVARLRGAGVAAAAVHSQLPAAEQHRALDAALGGRLRFLYAAPERLVSPGFEDVLARLPVTRFVVDEAHCISGWGHDFRPEYRRLAAAVALCGRPPVTAVTATATPRVRDDIGHNLRLRDPLVLVTGFLRPELDLVVWRCRRGAEKREAVRRALAEIPGRALVYCGRTRDCDEVAAGLRGAGVVAAAYHAGLEPAARQAVQADFGAGRLRVVVATSAFGMGVDVADVRQVIHHDFPSSLEAYYQEAGRAGRDGRASRCLLLYSPADRDLQEFFIEQAYPDRAVVRAVYRALLRAGRWDLPDIAALTPELGRRSVEAAVRLLEGAGALLPGGGVRRLTAAPVDFDERDRLRAAALARLNQMMAYAATRECRHARIADYFGQAGVDRSCSACDNCRAPRDAAAPVPVGTAVAALGAVARFDGHLGATRLGALLRGVDSAWCRERPWVRDLDFFAALARWSDAAVRALLDALVEQGLVRRGASERPTLALTAAGRAALRGGSEPRLTLPAAAAAGEGPGAGDRSPSVSLAPGGAEAGRFEALRRWRREVARAASRPAFTVFDDRTLREIAVRDPASISELLGVRGVGPAKASRYGLLVLEVLGASGGSGGEGLP